MSSLGELSEWRMGKGMGDFGPSAAAEPGRGGGLRPQAPTTQKLQFSDENLIVSIDLYRNYASTWIFGRLL